MSEFEELLINETNKFPRIFAKKNCGFKNKLQREKAWAVVAGATKYKDALARCHPQTFDSSAIIYGVGASDLEFRDHKSANALARRITETRRILMKPVAGPKLQ